MVNGGPLESAQTRRVPCLSIPKNASSVFPQKIPSLIGVPSHNGARCRRPASQLRAASADVHRRTCPLPSMQIYWCVTASHLTNLLWYVAFFHGGHGGTRTLAHHGRPIVCGDDSSRRAISA